jgi:hypothetical protein
MNVKIGSIRQWYISEDGNVVNPKGYYCRVDRGDSSELWHVDGDITFLAGMPKEYADMDELTKVEYRTIPEDARYMVRQVL